MPVTANAVAQWFAQKNWSVFAFQQQVWNAFLAGGSGLLHATTGSGKTYAIFLGALQALHVQPRTVGVRILWITPMRALAADTAQALQQALDALMPGQCVGVLTGDTEASQRSTLLKKPPLVLVSTPESVSLMIARSGGFESLYGLDTVVVDEWHELLGNKRGVQVQLALACVLRAKPTIKVWGLSATLGNLEHARDVLLHAVNNERGGRHLVQAHLPKPLQIDTLIPDVIERFPWAGHLGARQVASVAKALDDAQTALVFTNTRAQAELWYQALLEARPQWAGLMALHHGALDKGLRTWVETGLKTGDLKVVVCTSSLDLGVDFLPVQRVFQVGSVKGVARLLQRAGRSGHAPDQTSRITLVPTHAFELVEAAAVRLAVQVQHIEARFSPEAPLDVLVQHLVTVAAGPGFKPEALIAEVRMAYAYRHLSAEQFAWALAFVEGGGDSLRAYPDFHRIAVDQQGNYRVFRQDIARRHRMSIGTIVADASVAVAWFSGGRIGTVEENFIARLKPGDCFTLAGRVLELVKVRDMTAYVRKAPKGKGAVPQWQGGKMPLSAELAKTMLCLINAAADSSQLCETFVELQALMPLFALQDRWSALPTENQLLVEIFYSRQGYHLCVYPFLGRNVCMGLASVLAFRMANKQAGTFSLAANDYGFELLSAEPFDWELAFADPQRLFDVSGLLDDIKGCLNASEMAQRRFREIARIAGLVFQGYPGAPKTARQVQASSGLFYQVFAQYDPNNLLLKQAQAEALQHELNVTALTEAMQGLQTKKICLKQPPQFTPLAFPLVVERLRERVSTEQLDIRIERMLKNLEKAANGSV